MKKAVLLFLSFLNLVASGQTLTNAQVYDYLPGDVFQWTETDIYDMGIPCAFGSLNTYHTDSIISKYYSAASDTVFYYLISSTYKPVQCNPTLPPIYTTANITRYYTDLSLPATSYYNIPICAPTSDSFYVGWCGKNIWERWTNTNNSPSCFEFTDWWLSLIEGCGSYLTYKGGYGGEPHFSQTLTYYKKSGVPCGTYSTVGISEKEIIADMQLYPNPNSGKMTYQYTLIGETNGVLCIIDLSGKVVSKYNLQMGTNNILNIDQQELPNGIYFYNMLLNGEVKSKGKIVIIKDN